MSDLTRDEYAPTRSRPRETVMSISDQEHLDYLRDEADGAEADLYLTVVRDCPGNHKTKQYRDGRPPWCKHCGRTDRGERIKHVDQ